jgi:hypothetical protein
MTEQQERVSPSIGVERLEAVTGPHVRRPLVRFRMTSASEEDSAEFPDERCDDTIELALTKEDMLALSRAAEEEHAETSLDKSALIATGPYLRDQSVRSRRWPPLLAASVLAIVVGIVIGVVWGMVADRSPKVAIGVPSAATRLAKSLELPIRFSNPFDASESFEFPPGTSDDRARQSMAATLLQRARDREGVGIVKGNPPARGAAADRAHIARNSEPGRTFSEARASFKAKQDAAAAKEAEKAAIFKAKQDAAVAELERKRETERREHQASVAGEAAREAEWKRTKREYAAQRMARGGVKVGMTEQQVLSSSWGDPDKRNHAFTPKGDTERWVYADRFFLYFVNGILTRIETDSPDTGFFRVAR